MIYRQLGRSDLQVPVVTFGAWAIGGWMWGPSDDELAVAAIRRAVDVGVTASGAPSPTSAATAC
jgi:aryl-alcohol dehydrogenase-like predicted oxidoreductase